MDHEGVRGLQEHLPKSLASLDLSENAIGDRAAVRIKTNKKGERRQMLNKEHGGKSGHTSYGSISQGVVCIHRETGRCYKVNSHNKGLTFGDTKACKLTDLQTDEVRKTPFWCRFVPKEDHFTKTGSGQT
jgi:hypothetical protein